MALGKAVNRINIKGGGLLYIAENGATPTYNLVGYLKESQIIDSHAQEDANDETGEYVGLLLGDRKVQFKSSLMQTTKEEIDLLRDSIGTYFLARYQVTLNNGQIQLWSLGLCQINPNVDLTFNTKQRALPLELILLKGQTTGLYYETAEVDSPVEEGDWPAVN